MTLGDPPITRSGRAALAILLLALSTPATTLAGDTPQEIEFLLDAIGQSGCTFIRNGTEHSAPDAEAHLRMKYRKGKQYAPTADLFIERLATESSWTHRAYMIACPDVPKEPSGRWLSKRLADLRAGR